MKTHQNWRKYAVAGLDEGATMIPNMREYPYQRESTDCLWNKESSLSIVFLIMDT